MNGPRPPGGHDRRDPQDRAADLLRQHTDEGWVAIADDVLTRAMAVFRPSAPVRGRHADGEFFVSSDVLVEAVRHEVEQVPLAAPTTITCTTDEDDVLVAVVVQVVVAYGAHLLTVAEDVRSRALLELREVLGQLAPEPAQIHTHVHVADVTDDPRFTR